MDPATLPPLFDADLCAELYAPQDEAMTALQRRIWQGVRGSLGDDLDLTESAAACERKEILHRMRGYASTAGLLRLPEMLRSWENDAELLAAPGDLPARCREAARASVEAVESAYPQLAD